MINLTKLYKYNSLKENNIELAKSALQYVNKTRTAIDVGAHVGTFAIHLCPIFDKVICIEPVSENCTALKEVLSPLFNNFEIVEGACSDVDTTATMELVVPTMQASLSRVGRPFYVSGRPIPNKSIQCKFFQLDIVVTPDEPIDFIKIDCEGMELAVLKGATDIINTHHPVILIETKYNAQEIRDYLLSLQYCPIAFFRIDDVWKWQGHGVVHT